jgi:hypothetical protein
VTAARNARSRAAFAAAHMRQALASPAAVALLVVRLRAHALNEIYATNLTPFAPQPRTRRARPGSCTRAAAMNVPSQTLYIQNINEKTKKQGACGRRAARTPALL